MHYISLVHQYGLWRLYKLSSAFRLIELTLFLKEMGFDVFGSSILPSLCIVLHILSFSMHCTDYFQEKIGSDSITLSLLSRKISFTACKSIILQFPCIALALFLIKTCSDTFACSIRYQDKNPPDKNPPDISPRTKTPWTKTPLAKNPPDKNPPENTKYILHK